jgi:hypothetical protein
MIEAALDEHAAQAVERKAEEAGGQQANLPPSFTSKDKQIARRP